MNFGPKNDDAQPVSWIVEQMVKIWGNGAAWTKEQEKQPHETKYLKLDTSKATRELSWNPRWDIQKALEKIIIWHKAWLSCENLNKITTDQINEYTITNPL